VISCTYVQMVSIYGQAEQCSEACREILTIMQREATNANRGFVTHYLIHAHLFLRASNHGSKLSRGASVIAAPSKWN